jgi:Ca-activated chloride channel family protein
MKPTANNKLADKILILLTDGANTAGEVEPIKAAQLAAQSGLKIYTIGIGADEMLVRSFFGVRKYNPSTDLDEDALKKIAKETGGKYFRARDTEELQKIYQLLDKLEPVTKETQQFRPVSSLFMWPLALAMLLASIVVVIRLRR